MKKCSAIKALLFAMIFGSAVHIDASATSLTPEQILTKELLLNQLMTHIHLLQLDFKNTGAREKLQERLIEITAVFDQLPKESSDTETSELLSAVQSLWPVINRHTQWLVSLPEQSAPPEAQSLMRALEKLDRQLLLLRQKTINNDPKASRQFRFLEQALFMQRITREYLGLLLLRENADNTLSGRMQLQTMATHFDQRLDIISNELKNNPHANPPLKQSRAAWLYISRSITHFPEQRVPLMVVRYNDRIVKKLTSVQRML